jgi:hypothetical protein
VGRLLGRLGWSCQKPERRAVERDEEAIGRWKRYGWVGIKKSRAPESTPGVPGRNGFPLCVFRSIVVTDSGRM